MMKDMEKERVVESEGRPDAGSGRPASTLPLERRRGDGGYHPMSFFRKREKGTVPSPFVKISPSWSSVAILMSVIFRGLISSRNQWYFNA